MSAGSSSRCNWIKESRLRGCSEDTQASRADASWHQTLNACRIFSHSAMWAAEFCWSYLAPSVNPPTFSPHIKDLYHVPQTIWDHLSENTPIKLLASYLSRSIMFISLSKVICVCVLYQQEVLYMLVKCLRFSTQVTISIMNCEVKNGDRIEIHHQRVVISDKPLYEESHITLYILGIKYTFTSALITAIKGSSSRLPPCGHHESSPT